MLKVGHLAHNLQSLFGTKRQTLMVSLSFSWEIMKVNCVRKGV